MSFKVTWKLHVLCFFIAYIFCLIEQNNISALFINIFFQNKIINLTGNILVDISIFIFIVFIPITFVHEMIHGFAYRLFGGKVKYGFKGVFAYTKETSGLILHRTKFAIVLLAPVTVISVVSLIIPYSIGLIIFFLNLLGSTGDIVMALFLCKSKENSYVIDREYGFDVVELQKQ